MVSIVKRQSDAHLNDNCALSETIEKIKTFVIPFINSRAGIVAAIVLVKLINILILIVFVLLASLKSIEQYKSSISIRLKWLN